MKKTFCVLALAASSLFFSQLAVTDIGANYTMTQQLASSAKQLKELQGTYKVMKAGYDKYQKLNGYVQQMGHLQNIISKQNEAINNAKKIVEIATKKKYNVSSVTKNLQQISGSVKTIQALLKDGIFQMDDSQRINLLEKETEKVSSASAAIKIKLIKMSY
jgi:hypothetical protein